jgi:hypothetical protein
VGSSDTYKWRSVLRHGRHLLAKLTEFFAIDLSSWAIDAFRTPPW